MRNVPAALALVLVATSCGAPEHENPFDPRTPADRQARATLAGDVTLEPLGAAAPDLSGVRISIPGAGVVDTDTAGHWSLPDVPPGTYTVQASKTGWVTAAVAGIAIRLDDGDSTVAVPPIALAAARGALAGRVTLSGAGSSAGIVVTVAGPATTTAVTDAAGDFLLSGLPVGGYTVVARKDPEWQPSAPVPVTVATAAVTTLPTAALSLRTTGSISGVAGVERPAGADGGIDVVLSGADPNGAPVTRSTVTLADGTYLLDALPQGTYTLGFSKASYDPWTVSGIFVAAGASAGQAPVTLPVAKGTVEGTVVLSAGAATGFQVGTDRSGVVVTLSGSDVPVPAATTDAAGVYRFVDVPVSTSGAAYGVTASKASFLADSTTVTAAANTVQTAPPLTLAVDVGALSGTVLLRDGAGGAGDNGTHGGTLVGVTGTAFNGTSWSASDTTADDGTWLLPALPPGSYDVVATSASRTCAELPLASVTAGGALSLGTVRCEDALAPTAVGLGAPLAPPGGQSGYAPGTSVTVPVSVPATDATLPVSNLRGYELVVGSAADWASAALVEGPQASLVFTGLTPDATNTLWARAVDWTGNAGPVATAQVVSDTIPPPAPAVATPRTFVDATTTSVTLSGAEGDATFAGYEICTVSQGAAVACAGPAPGACAWTSTAAAFALSLPAGQRTCLWARAFDRAGHRGGVSSLGAGGVVSDLVLPSPPTLAPSYDPTLLTVRAAYVDLFVTAAATDGPAGGADWQHVAWLEVDTGAGFEPLCPAAACRPSDVWTPCGCGCTDRRLLCDGTRFVGVRAHLLEGTRNTVAVRAVDLAGNVGSGVSQQVQVESTGAILSATAEIEQGPNLRGNLVAFSSWTPGVGNPRGIVASLGADRRFGAADARCEKAPVVASGYGRGIAPVSPTVVADAEWAGGVWIHEAGPDAAFCTSDDTSNQLRVPEVDPVEGSYYADGVSGAGDVVAWWERLNTPQTGKLWVQEAGADRLFRTADDRLTLLATVSEISALTAGTNALLAHLGTCTTGCVDTWRLFSPDDAGSYAGAVTTLDLEPYAVGSSVSAAGLSADGRRAAWVDAAGNLLVRSSGKNGAFDAADDTVAVKVIPPSWGLWAAGTSAMGVDDSHVVLAAIGSPVSSLVHWWAGLDGEFGTGDDTLSRTHPTNGQWGTISLDSGLVAFEEDSDLKLLDLSTLRWEAAPQEGFGLFSQALAVDGRGNLVYRGSSGTLVGRTPGGRESSGPSSAYFAADGVDLLAVEGADVVRHGPDGQGGWFGAGAPAPAAVYTAVGNLGGVALGDGKAIVLDVVGSNASRFKILEPGAGTLATFATTGTVLDALGVDQGWAMAHGITARQAFFTCNGITTNLCVRTASGAGGTFAAGDPVVYLRHPAGSPPTPSFVHDARAFLVSGRRMLFAEFSPPALYLLDAGRDLLFGTGDDRGRKLADGYFSQLDIALAGRMAAFVAEGPPAGRQVHLVTDFTETPVPVSAHYSTKGGLVLEPGGRAFWVDSVFVPQAVFVRAP